MSQQNKRLDYFDRQMMSQDNRLHEALRPSYFKIDDRTLADHLAYIAEYAQEVLFYDVKNKKAGTWEDFFLNDITVLLSNILSTNLNEIDNEYIEVLNEIISTTQFASDQNTSNPNSAWGKLNELVFKLAAKVDFWYKYAYQLENRFSSEKEGILSELENIIENQLSHKLKLLLDFESSEIKSRGVNDTAPDKPSKNLNLDASLWLGSASSEISPLKTRNVDYSTINNAKKINELDIIFQEFRDAIKYILQVAPKYFEESLLKKSNHGPDTGLYIAFLALFDEAKKHLNSITQQHLQYYFKRILKQKQKTSIPDKVYVYAELVKLYDNFKLKKGTRLAGQVTEAGFTPIYTTDFDIILTQTQIEELKTLYISRNSENDDKNVNNSVSDIFDAPVANSSDGQGKELEIDDPSWATFGEPQLDETIKNRTMRNSDIGIIIASPILYLREGEREVHISFLIENESTDTSIIEELSDPDKLQTILTNSLDIYITTEEGWVLIDEYHVTPTRDWRESEFVLSFHLDMAFPPVVGNNPNIIPSHLPTSYPMVKIQLTSKLDAYIYSLLHNLEIATIDIDVTVKNMRQLELFNEFGQLDGSKPFQPFGPVPAIGSYLVIANDEAFKKNLTDVNFDVKWHNLPINLPNGFKDYYHSYGVEFANDVFEVAISALNNYTFFPLTEVDPIRFELFQTKLEENQKTPLNEESVFKDIPLEELNISPTYNLKPIDVYDNFTATGVFKLELVNPPDGFGNDIYLEAYTNTILENSRKNNHSLIKKVFKYEEEKPELLPLPNTPFVPVMKSLSMGYSAKTTIDYTSNQNNSDNIPEDVFHIHPFGYEHTFNKGKINNSDFIPSFEEDGYLYIGLNNLKPPQQLSIYFELAEGKHGNTNNRLPSITWSFLSNNTWHPFNVDQILKDSTEGFTTSGIVILDIPNHISRDNTIMPNHLHWLRVAAKGNITLLSYTLSVHTQAVSATWAVDEEDISHLDAPLPSGEIKSPEGVIQEIAKIFQPYPSFGGHLAETQEQFYARVSERLRHKGRAITNWDYERLVLEKFPNIQQVKCFSHISNPHEITTIGEVTVLVIPKPSKDRIDYEPKTNFHVLHQIKNYLTTITSPFTSIEVRNPSYESIKVSCHVRFEKYKNNGEYIQKLNTDINEFLTPYASSDNKEINLAGHISKNTVINFIEQLPYVDVVTSVELTQITIDDKGNYSAIDTVSEKSSNTLSASKPWSILVPIKKHRINIMEHPEQVVKSNAPSTIGNMEIEYTFIIADDQGAGDESIPDQLIREHSHNQIRRLSKSEKDMALYFLDLDIDLMNEE